MKFNKKGQGALEYLLLIGGAVLIAVIVIALLVGMGSQSRETAKDQADKAQQVTDFPQAAHIVSVEANYADCSSKKISKVNWTSMGGGGSHTLKIYNTDGEMLAIETVDGDNKSVEKGTYILDPTKTVVEDIVLKVDIGTKNCGDSYFVEIESSKNNQTVKSQRYKFSWN